jgi:peptidoglycan/LPS O-acetylase OafA/YrhL
MATHERNEIVGIQYLRGVAAMFVVVFHLSMQMEWMNPTATLLKTFQSGVDLFFVISGYIMFQSTRGGTGLDAFEFFKRRLIRIAPLYWLATLAMVAVLLIAPQFVKQAVLSFPHAAASLAFFPAPNPAAPGHYGPLVTVGWTLNYEMLFYALFAVAIAAGRKQPERVLMFTAAPIVALSLAGIIFRPEGIVGFYTNPVMLEFVFGMILAATVARPQARSAIFLALIPLMLLLMLVPPMGDGFYRTFRFGILAVLIVAAALLAPWPRSWILRLLGDASYSVYISHFFVLSAFTQAWKRLGLSTDTALAIGSFYVLGFIVSAIVGVLCWRLVEAPLSEGLRYLRRPAKGELRPLSPSSV